MKDFLNRAVLLVLSLIFSATIIPAVANAQTSVGLQIKPAVVEDNVNPGEVHQYTLTVTNISSVAGTYYLSAQDIKGVDSGGRPIFATGNQTSNFGLTDWITLPQGSVNLAPGESKSVAFSVRIPQGASPGSHFASVFFSDKPVAPTTNGSGVGFNVGSIVSLRIAGDIHEDAQLQEFSTGKLVYPSANVDFSTRVQNMGNILVQPTGSIDITNFFGKKIASIVVNQDLASVFPGSDRIFSSNWTTDTFEFGRYQAIVSLAYGDTDQGRKTIYSTTSFWILPLVPIAAVLGTLIVVILAIFMSMRMYIRRKLRQMGVTNATQASTDLYRRRYQRSGSRLIVATFFIILLCVLILIAVFMLFA